MPSTRSPENVATPFASVDAVAPAVTDPAPDVTAAVTSTPACLLLLPETSLSRTIGCVVMATPFVAPVGAVTMPMATAAPAIGVTVVEFTISDACVKRNTRAVVSPVNLRSVKVPKPPTSVSCVSVPASVGLPEKTLAVTLTPAVATGLPLMSAT